MDSFWSYVASEHHPPDTLNWEILIVHSQGDSAPRKPEARCYLSLPANVGMLLRLSQIQNYLLGIWILNKRSKTVKVVGGRWSL